MCFKCENQQLLHKGAQENRLEHKVEREQGHSGKRARTKAEAVEGAWGKLMTRHLVEGQDAGELLQDELL